MSQSISISAKIPKALKKKVDSLGINVSETVREALAREVDRQTRISVMSKLRACPQE